MGQIDWKMPCVADDIDKDFSAAGFKPLLSAVLRSRGLDTPDKARNYLRRDKTLLCDPMQLSDMDKAVSRIELAIESR